LEVVGIIMQEEEEECKQQSGWNGAHSADTNIIALYVCVGKGIMLDTNA